MKEIQAIVRHLTSGTGGGVLVTLTSVQGSSYRRPGARMLVDPDGRRIGSVSGGCLEEDLVLHAAGVSRSGVAQVVTYDTSAENDLVWGVGLGCHGVVKILLEPVPPGPEWARRLQANMDGGLPTLLETVWESDAEPLGTRLASGAGVLPRHSTPGVFLDRVEPPSELAIFGAGDDAQPVCRIALELGWRVCVADPRPAMATAARFAGAHRTLAGPAEGLVDQIAPRDGSLAIVMTHHYRHDVPILRGLLARDLGFLGLLGPKKRSERILGDLASGGLSITPAMRSRLHAPVGLDIGADAPEEVALSIIAEMKAALTGRDARPLRERLRPIHG